MAHLRTALLLAAAALSAPAAAATLSTTGFSYDGGALQFSTGGAQSPLWAEWNPRPSAANTHVLSPGVHIFFFGHAPSCPAGATNGPAGPLDTASRASLDALPARAPAGATVWSPRPDPAQCQTASPNTAGPAFIAAAPAAVQLFTAVLPAARAGRAAFWGTFTAAGQNGAGANASIEGTFVVWRFDWQNGKAITPWATGPRPLSIATTQSVDTVSADAEPPGATPTQSKQQLAVDFLNPSCIATQPNKRLCQLQFLFDIDLVRKPGTDWASLAWADYGRLMFDPGQGGLPVIEGPLHQQGGDTVVAGPARTPLWRSAGAATQHGSFGSQNFEARMGFGQFLNGLRMVAQRASNTQGQVTPAAMAGLIGPRWNDPAAWSIISISLGQEVHSPGGQAAGTIGGTISHVAVGAAP